jgi:glycosyltransferase involved in cell wall biosynthesis
MCCSVREKRTSHLHKLASKLEMKDRILWKHQLGRDELNQWVRHAALSVAPLTECSRNVEQGCAPLKILESMALGVPVVSTLIPSVEELMTDGCEGFLVRPNRPSELAREIRIGLEYPDKLAELGRNGTKTIRERYSWDLARRSLSRVYNDLIRENSFQMLAEMNSKGAI